MTPDQRKRLHAAILSAFPTQSSLAPSVWYSLGVNLADIVPNLNRTDTVLQLLQWAVAHNRLRDLLQALRADAAEPALATENQLLAKIVDEVLSDEAKPDPVADPDDAEAATAGGARCRYDLRRSVWLDRTFDRLSAARHTGSSQRSPQRSAAGNRARGTAPQRYQVRRHEHRAHRVSLPRRFERLITAGARIRWCHDAMATRGRIRCGSPPALRDAPQEER